MNFREGTRRLGIVLGVLGGSIGAFEGYLSARDLWNAGTGSRKFESLMDSPTMLKVARAAKDCVQSRFYQNRTKAKPDKSGGPPVVRPYALNYADGTISLAEGTPAPVYRAPADIVGLTDKGGKTIPTFEEFKKQYQDVPPPPDMLPSDFFSKDGNEIVHINANGIRDVMMDGKGVVKAIHLATGEWVEESVVPPPLRSYAILFLYPILGFVLPWGAIRILTWIGAGFFEPTRI